jgi:hypothetical protein
MRPKPTIVLLIVAAVAVAYFLLVEQPRHKKAVERTTRAEALTQLAPGDFTKVSIQRPDVTLEFERRDGVWEMIEPAMDKADPRPLNTLLGQITKSKIEKRFSIETTGFGEYGLDDPAAALRLSTETDDDAMVLYVGDFNMTKDRCFARFEAAPDVMLVPAGIRRSALLSSFQFRNKRVFELPVAGIRRLKMISNGRSLDWTRGDSNSWYTVVMEDTLRGDPTRIDNIVRELRGLRAKEIPSPLTDPGAYFPEVAGTIILWDDMGEDETTVTFSNEKQDGGTCYVTVSPSERVSLVESTVLRVFENTYNDLRDRRLLNFDPKAAARIVMLGPDVETAIVRSGSDWTFTNPEFGSIEPATVDALFTRIRNLEYSSALEETLRDRNGYGFDAPSYRLTILDSSGQVIDELRTGSPLADDTYIYATSLSAGVLASVEDSLVAELIAEFQNLSE